jgi:hypothetical protein
MGVVTPYDVILPVCSEIIIPVDDNLNHVIYKNMAQIECGLVALNLKLNTL